MPGPLVAGAAVVCVGAGVGPCVDGAFGAEDGGAAIGSGVPLEGDVGAAGAPGFAGAPGAGIEALVVPLPPPLQPVIAARTASATMRLRADKFPTMETTPASRPTSVRKRG